MEEEGERRKGVVELKFVKYRIPVVYLFHSHEVSRQYADVFHVFSFWGT
jgi:hypothetical protein